MSEVKKYNLYFKKSECILKITLVKKSPLTDNYTDEIKLFNDNYYICTDRKKLKEFANKLREKWIKEFQENIDKLNGLKI